MNLGQAVAVCLYELAREGMVPVLSVETAPASAAELERVTAVLLKTLQQSDSTTAHRLLEGRNLRRLVRRMHLSAEDASTLARHPAPDPLEAAAAKLSQSRPRPHLFRQRIAK